jgi:lipopolysaccharide export system protein LptA
MPRAAIFLAVLLAPLCTMATDDDRQQPVNLRADRIDVDQKTGVSLYRGHVLFTQGTLKLTAARAQAVNRGSVVETITAEGAPVTFRHRPEGQQEFIEGEAGRAVYHAPTRRVDLYQNVNLRRDRDNFRGAVLHYDMENRSLTAAGDTEGRVYVALAPRIKPAPPGDRP